MDSLYIILIFLGIVFLLLGYFGGKYTAQLNNKQKLSELQLQHETGLRERENEQHVLSKEWEMTLQKVKQEAQQIYNELTQQMHEQEKDFLVEKNSLEKKLENTQKDIETWQEKWQLLKEEFAKNEEILQEKFENLAQKILDDKSKKFTEQNRVNLDNILTPFQKAMEAFKQKVEHTNDDNLKRHGALLQQLSEMQKLNKQLNQEAANLTKALKGESKTQGTWGETILNRLLEKSGLEKGREYFVQQSFQAADDSERLRVQPDVIIQLPDNKKMVIDAKVSLTAYEKYSNEDDTTQAATHLKQHIASLKSHISGLAKKSYDQLLEGETPEFILMFIPIEPAFSLALREESALYNYAFDRNIILVTPTTLLATLKIVDNMWRNEKQRQNAFEIAKQAGALYDKFAGLVKDIELIGGKLDNAKDSYTNAMKKLSTGNGNLLGKVEKLKELGAKAKKQLPQADA